MFLRISTLLLCLTLSAHASDFLSKKDAKWLSTEKNGEWSTGGFTVRNNVWGQGPGPETIWADSGHRFSVWADHPDTTGTKSYPHSERVVNKRISELDTATTRFSCRVPGAGTYNTAYDIWLNSKKIEVMLWLNWNGNVGPIAKSWDAQGKPAIEKAHVTVGGHTWTLYRGTNGYNDVISFVRDTQTTEGTIDLKAILEYVRTQGWSDDAMLGEIQLGWELTTTPAGGSTYEITDFGVGINGVTIE